jgi:predicted PurR-regulated permease PerM
VEKVQKALEDVVGEIQKTGKEMTGPKSVAVVLEPSSILAHLPTLLQALANAGIVTVLVIFMLLERRELRDRVILLIGYRRMTATTRALDEAGSRISRYLLIQCIINGSFGVAVGTAPAANKAIFNLRKRRKIVIIGILTFSATIERVHRVLHFQQHRTVSVCSFAGPSCVRQSLDSSAHAVQQNLP